MQYLKIIPKIKLLLVLPLIIASLVSVNGFALGDNFDANLVISDQDLYSLPLAFSSSDKIQAYLEARGSFLANYYVNVAFEPDDDIINPARYVGVADKYNIPKILAPYLNKQMRVSDLIWNMSQTSFGSGCNLSLREICADTQAQPINPGFLLAMIQKESGLIYGSNAKLNPNSASTQFLLDRVMGYYCFENPDPAKSCYDQNPDWKYFKGFFRQMYYSTRFLRLREDMCRRGGKYAFISNLGTFQVGSTVNIDGQSVTLQNGITCALYIYTPHVYNSQYNVWFVMREIGAGRDYINIGGMDPNYSPKMNYRRQGI